MLASSHHQIHTPPCTRTSLTRWQPAAVHSARLRTGGLSSPWGASPLCLPSQARSQEKSNWSCIAFYDLPQRSHRMCLMCSIVKSGHKALPRGKGRGQGLHCLTEEWQVLEEHLAKTYHPDHFRKIKSTAIYLLFVFTSHHLGSALNFTHLPRLGALITLKVPPLLLNGSYHNFTL